MLRMLNEEANYFAQGSKSDASLWRCVFPQAAPAISQGSVQFRHFQSSSSFAAHMLSTFSGSVLLCFGLGSGWIGNGSGGTLFSERLGFTFNGPSAFLDLVSEVPTTPS